MIIASFAAFDYGGAQDSDQWWLLATGREIVENGIPYMNPFSVYDDQAIVVQQWIPCVMIWSAYSLLGYAGFGVLVLLQIAFVTLSALLLVWIVSDKRPSELSFFAIAAMIGCASAYLSVRPQSWSMIFFLLILSVCEKYRRTNNKRLLVLLPVIVAVHANFHLSMMPFDFAIIVCYLMPRIVTRRFSTTFDDYARLPIIVALLFMSIAALANPYGIDGALYLINSYGSAAYGNYIAEMGTISPYDSYYGMLMIVMMALGLIAVGINGSKHIDLPLTMLFIACLVLSLQHVRNVWLVAVFALPLFASAVREVHFAPRFVFLRDDWMKNVICAIGIIAILCTGIYVNTSELNAVPKDNGTTPIVAADWLDANSVDKNSAKIFTHFNAGGYLEWRGYKVGMDARPELWDHCIAKNGADRYKEYIDFSKDKTTTTAYLADKNYDYAIVNEDTKMFTSLSGNSEWSVAAKGNGYTLFKHNSATLSIDSGNIDSLASLPTDS